MGRLRKAVLVGAVQAERGHFVFESVEEMFEEDKQEKHGRGNANLPRKAR